MGGGEREKNKGIGWQLEVEKALSKGAVDPGTFKKGGRARRPDGGGRKGI